MAFTLNNAGPTNLLTSTAGSTAKTGEWFRVPPKLRALAFQVVQVTSSVGATASSTTFIQVSNDGVNPIADNPITIALTGTTDTVSNGACFPTSYGGNWGWIRAKLNSLSSSTAGSVGSPSVTVSVCAGSVG